MKQSDGKTNFNYLLMALLLLMVAMPIADDIGLTNSPLVRGLIFSMMLLIGTWSLRGGKTYFAAGMTLAVAGILLNIVAVKLGSEFLLQAAMVSLIGFLMVAIVFTLGQIVFGREINIHRIVGAICVYLLLGAIWAMAYTLVNSLLPGSFAGFVPQNRVGWDPEWLYFSFVTMSTLGYGDILPISASARTLAWLQAVIGQFYIAVLVAGLVGAYIGDRQSQRVE